MTLSGSGLDLSSHLTKPVLTAAVILKCLKISQVSTQTFIHSLGSITRSLFATGTKRA
jgi:hypothetical protein